jgi:hypothetical protein
MKGISSLLDPLDADDLAIKVIKAIDKQTISDLAEIGKKEEVLVDKEIEFIIKLI